MELASKFSLKSSAVQSTHKHSLKQVIENEKPNFKNNRSMHTFQQFWLTYGNITDIVMSNKKMTMAFFICNIWNNINRNICSRIHWHLFLLHTIASFFICFPTYGYRINSVWWPFLSWASVIRHFLISSNAIQLFKFFNKTRLEMS